MSCRQTVQDLVRDCKNWSDAALADCTRESQSRVRRCAEEGQTTREECAEERVDSERKCSGWKDERRKECDAWGLLSFVCVAFVYVVERICQGWVWLTSTVCVAYRTIIETFCVAWEWIVIGVCSVGVAVARGFCWFTGIALGLVCGFLNLFTARLIQSDDDEPKAESVPRYRADAMSVAHVASEVDYKDSGERYFFRICNDVVELRSRGIWMPLAPVDQEPQSISFRRERDPRRRPAPKFDMVAANSGRVFAKEVDYARFYVTMLEPMFRHLHNEPVPSAYFKLDPEQGLSTATDQDRLIHLAGIESSHPAAVRFPLFRYALQLDLNDSMVVNLDRNLCVWHRIDARPPKDGGAPPEAAGFFPPIEVITEYQSNAPLVPVIKKTGYKIMKVLDIGVGHEHWHEQRCSIYGGELDSLDGPGLPPCLRGRNAYRLFNGPVEDQGGFIDGTVNYYVLAQFVESKQAEDQAMPRNAFGILWLDEQAVLSERWRLLDPDDSEFGSFKKLIPSAIVQYLESDFDYEEFMFDRSRFWCPMRAGFITPGSRMAVSRQVIVLSGRDPTTRDWELYSINFSFGTCDRTWRWRTLPLEKSDAGSTPKPEDFGLREDMTLFVKESRRCGIRYWYQRYLPGSGKMMPNGENLKLPAGAKRPDRDLSIGKPEKGFEHPWQWLPEDIFEFVHARFSHFGCLEEVINWRWQYYRVTPLDGDEALKAAGEKAYWSEVTDTLFILKDAIDWERLNNILRGGSDKEVSADMVQRLIILASAIPGAISGAMSGAIFDALFGALYAARDVTAIQTILCDIYDELRGSPLIRRKHRKGLFHEQFRLSLRLREPIGWIMVHWDKRDDDLLPFRDMQPEHGTPFELKLTTRQTSTSEERPVRLRIESYHLVRDVPAVSKACVTLMKRAPLTASILRFELTPVPLENGSTLDENLWRIKVGGLTRDLTGTLCGYEVLFNEVRGSATRANISGTGQHSYEWQLSGLSLEIIQRLVECCSEEGRQRFGTSLWFEDIVGHVAPADSVAFLTTKE